jgi:hypothetical protein
LSPRRWRLEFPPKGQFLRESHDVTYEYATFFIVTSVKTSNSVNLLFPDGFQSRKCRERYFFRNIKENPEIPIDTVRYIDIWKRFTRSPYSGAGSIGYSTSEGIP